jgi:hypothetical protein
MSKTLLESINTLTGQLATLIDNTPQGVDKENLKLLRGELALLQGYYGSYNSDGAKLGDYQRGVLTKLNEIKNDLHKDQLAALKSIENKKRLVQINTYYSNKYADYVFIAKVIILLCAIIIILSMLLRRSFISNGTYLIVVSSFSFIFISTIIYVLISMRYRDNVDYNKYRFSPPPYNSTSSSTSTLAKFGYGSAEGGVVGTMTYPEFVTDVVDDGSPIPGETFDYVTESGKFSSGYTVY